MLFVLMNRVARLHMHVLKRPVETKYNIWIGKFKCSIRRQTYMCYWDTSLMSSGDILKHQLDLDMNIILAPVQVIWEKGFRFKDVLSHLRVIKYFTSHYTEYFTVFNKLIVFSLLNICRHQSVYRNQIIFQVECTLGGRLN